MKSLRKKSLPALLLIGLLLVVLQGAALAAKAPAAPPVAPAAAPAPAFVIPVEIRDFTTDALGTMLVQRTRDAFAEDKRFKIGAAEPARVVVRLYTRGIAGKTPQTAYSFTVTFKLADSPDELFAGNTIGTCDQKEIPADAKGIVNMSWDQANNYPSILERIKKK